MVRPRRLALEGLESRRVMAGLVAVANDAGAAATSHIRLLDAETGAQVAATETPAFEAGFRGGVRLAMGDVTGDGVAEVIAAPGRGRVSEIRVFARQASRLVELSDYRIQPFGPSYTGGVELGHPVGGARLREHQQGRGCHSRGADHAPAMAAT